jgi:hypothetical protein
MGPDRGWCRLRPAWAKLTGSELERALKRVAEVRSLGAAAADVSALPGNRLLALARYGVSAKAPALRELAEPRRTATLLATVRHLKQKSIDDALDLLEVLMATRLLARAERESAKEQFRRLRGSRPPPLNPRHRAGNSSSPSSSNHPRATAEVSP